MTRFAVVAFWVALSATAHAQGLSGGAQQFDLQQNSTGEYELVPANPSFGASGSVTAILGADAGALKEWLALTNQDGSIEAYLALPESGQIGAGFLAGLEPGQALVKAEMPSFFGIQPLSAEQIRGIIQSMVNGAIAAVCDLGNARPTLWTTSVDISAGVGVSGTIQFGAEWETAKLCGDDAG